MRNYFAFVQTTYAVIPPGNDAATQLTKHTPIRSYDRAGEI
jgi:hypothetical protein